MFSWRLLGIGLVILLAGALVSLALSAPAAEEGSAALRQAQGASVAATPIVHEFAVVTNPYTQTAPAISGNVVVWEDYRSGNFDIYGKNIDTGLVFQITSNTYTQTAPAISGNTVVWEDFRNYSFCDPFGNCYGEIYGKNLAAGPEFLVSSGYGRLNKPAISGDIVVWANCGWYPVGVYGKNLVTGHEFAVADTSPYCPGKVAIEGDVVVWEQYTTTWDIYGKNIASGARFDIATGSH